MTNTTTNSRKRHHRPLLWTALIVSTICNAATSIAGLGLIISATFGVLTVLSAAGLIADYRRR